MAEGFRAKFLSLRPFLTASKLRGLCGLQSIRFTYTISYFVGASDGV